MADFTEQQYRDAAKRAMAAGDTASANELIAAGMALSAATQAAPTVTPNADPMLPSGDTDTRSTQEYLRDTGATPENPLIDARSALGPQAMRTEGGAGMDLLRSGASGVARGATELAALPDTVGGGLDWVYEKLGLIPEGARENVPTVRGAIRGASSALTSGGTDYEPQTTPGDYAQTVGEFVGGGAGAKPGILGGLLSEGAGQATEGTSLEPWARIAGGIAGGIAGTPRPTNAPVRNPNSAAGQRAIAANELRKEGINITRGQQTNSPLLRRMEGTLDAPDMQPERLTEIMLRRLGSDSRVATPQAMASIQDDVVKQMDDAIRGVDVVPSGGHAQAADAIATRYISNVETGDAVPIVKEIAAEIASVARKNSATPLEVLRRWRQDIGGLTVSSNDKTRRAAHALRSLIDDMTDRALTAAGRDADIQNLASARIKYRDFLAVRDAMTRASAESGVLSPTQLNQSFTRVMGRENVGIGRTTEAAKFARDAAAVMRSAPTVSSGGMRSVENLPMLLGGAGGFAAGGVPGLLAGAAAPIVGQAAMRSAPIQALLTNPATVFGQASRNIPGLLAQENNR